MAVELYAGTTRFEEVGVAPDERLHLGWAHVRSDLAHLSVTLAPGVEGEIIVVYGGVEDEEVRVTWGWHVGWIPLKGAGGPAGETPLDWLRDLGWGCCTRCGFLDGLPCLCRREAAAAPRPADELAQELARVAPLVLGLQQHWAGLWRDVARRVGGTPPQGAPRLPTPPLVGEGAAVR